MENFVLIMNHVSKKYGGVIALEDVDFDIKRGEVHCLVGENGSGKSTLVKIITGVIEPEPGAEIIIESKRVRALNPREALKRGIHVVHQDLSLFPNLTVAENISLHSYAERVFTDWREIEEIASRVLERLGVELDLTQTVGRLPLADQQLVAICRAIASDARLMIMDEPTSSLTSKEVYRLFGIIRDIQKRGFSTLFISHRLDEVLEIGERVTVLRNGKKVGSYSTAELDKRKLISLMTGKEPAEATPSTFASKDVVFEVKGLTREGQFEDVSFVLHRGEILGMIGPKGAGRTEVALSIFGLNPPDSGEIYLDQKPVHITSTRIAIKLGIGYLPENRLLQGLVLEHSLENNAVITNLGKITGRLGFIDRKKKSLFAEESVRNFNIVTSGINAAAKTLSGGNQQKLVLAKWIRTEPRILILDSPTNGVDVGAKESIHKLINELSHRGISILLISDEEAEIIQNCRRTLVMRDGRIVGVYDTTGVTEEELREIIREYRFHESKAGKTTS
ncbi:MAG: sugar ABC transporter ATP-binding protein [Spirochaetota bacterium]